LARKLLQTRGIDSTEKGTRRGSLHRFWINLKIDLGAGDAALLKTVVYCEREAVQTYQEALENISDDDPLDRIL
jgi:hypothetical protein